jgi:hypothetical protein
MSSILPADPLRWDPDAREELQERACLILDGCFGGDDEAWPEAWRMAVRCVRVRVDRERRIVYPALPASPLGQDLASHRR